MQQSRKHRQNGFTIPEMLLVILITVILLAVSVVGIVTYMRHLRLTELDNAAKEIFMSAQNRAILLSGGQRLEQYVIHADDNNCIDQVEIIPGAGGASQITVYYIHSSDANIQQLLPQETIESALWDGDFYIVYEPTSASVVDVLFTNKSLPVEGDFPTFYRQWRSASKDARMHNKPMIGYYGGTSAESNTAISLRTPVINIYNENTLRAEITYWVPRTLAAIGEADNVKLTTTLSYQGQNLTLDHVDADINKEPGIEYLAYTYTWTLDSLEQVHFKNFFSVPGRTLIYGNDFTIHAEVAYTGKLNVTGASKSAQDNSLFANGSDGDTAYIACLRHLQNLDMEFSGVDEKVSALQQRDIMEVEGYIFKPIQNIKLQEYDGAEFSIYDLRIGGNGTDAAGLFGVFGGTKAAPKELRNIRLVDTAVTAGAGPAGAMIGSGRYINLDNCQVYWENRSDQATNLQDVLGNSDIGLNYQITSAGPSGGLAGKLEHTKLKDCSASTLVKGEGVVGGLVGEGSGLTFTRTYAASYLQGPLTAGLVGNLTGSADISSSYAVGFMDSRGDAAGLCLGSGTAKVTKAYSAMLFTSGKRGTNYPLCQSGTYHDTYYLASDVFDAGMGEEALAKPYGVLTDPAQWDALFGAGTFAAMGSAQSHPYNLQTTLALTTFIYPGLDSLDHWGDWGAQFQNGSLVYYERYADGSYGFSGGDVSRLGDQVVTEDGYAVAYRSTESISGIGAELDVTYQTAQGEQTCRAAYGNGESGPIYEVKNIADDAGESGTYYLLPLPGEVVNTEHAAQNFYQKITITDVGGRMEQSYYYSPHFANTILPYEEGVDLGKLAKQLRVEVRSPRHLYMLSRFPTYYTSGHQYRFLQPLDLDYRVYTAYDLFTGEWTQAPIGLTARSPFRGSYHGNYHTITGVRTAVADDGGEKYQYVGLFGYSTSVLADIVYRMEHSPAITVSQSGSSSAILYVGGLVGYNGGTVDNCAVSGGQLNAFCFEYSRVYLGGLAGINEGVIRSSAVEAASVMADASMSNAYAGGFVGRNAEGGMIRQCYAVGRVSVSRARHGTVYACGFAGQNEAILDRSYAAADLSAEGGGSFYGFCPDSSTNCAYLNDGTFTYREEHYAAQYEDPAASPVTWAQLVGQEESEAVAALGMAADTAAFDSEKPYPYPGIVVDGEGSPIHYGQWPDQMDLGTMGVYYWEKMAIGNTHSYHFSSLSLANGEVVERDTLSMAHSDGGIITEYGYGYFHLADTPRPTLVSEELYWDQALFDPQGVETNVETNKALADLTSGRYTFYSYDTWQAEKQAGLHLVLTEHNRGSDQPPVAAWTLTQGKDSMSVRLNPFFADAMASEADSLPGMEDNPYQVRSIEQLQFINWNGVHKNTNTVMVEGNNHEFLSLSYGNGGRLTQRAFHWEQTHDFQGKRGVNYTPIAEFYDPTNRNQGGLFGWFGGTYNGNDYVIADVNIRGQVSSCVGLFGTVFDGTLKNIVLHSTDGTATVAGSDSGESRWYAIGGLAGIAGSQRGSAVVNCAVTGYTIQDTHRATKKGGWGGTGLGGLIGVSNMNLEGCTAVTKIRLNSVDNDNVRMGGLVGSCQGKISSCYTGGNIQIAKTSEVYKHRGIYAGGIVGGIYTKHLKVGGGDIMIGRPGQNLQNTLENCYSYMTLPNASSNKYIKGLYAVGGSGELNRTVQEDDPNHKNADHGWTNYSNNYYLSSVVLEQNNGTIGIDRTDIKKQGVTGLTYDQMSDTVSADGLLHRLNAGGGGFSTVTVRTIWGDSITGRYSFGSDPSLLGKNYPFPTILTQASSIAEGGMANVHYGDWPLAGIRREYGALPVRLDLFADYQQADDGAVWRELLTLSGVSEGGVWSVVSQEEDIATATLKGTAGNERTLQITGQGAGSTIVTVSYEMGGSTYRLSIEVNVTAQLRLVAAASPTLSFADGTAVIPLELRDRHSKVLPEPLKEKIHTTDFTAEFDPGYFSQAEIQQEDGLTLTVVSRAQKGSTLITAGYDFTYLEREYHDTSVLPMQVEQAEITLPTLEFTFEKDAQEGQSQTYAGDGFNLTVGGQEKPVTNVQLIGFQEVSEEFKQIIQAQWQKDRDGVEQIGTLSVTALPQQVYPAQAVVTVQFQFGCEGSTHILWRDLPIRIEQTPEPEQPEPKPEQPEEVEP